jgi:hypothetical protein
MRRIMLGMVLLLVFIFLYKAGNSMSQEMVSKSEGTSKVSNLFGAAVINRRGKDLGTIIDVVVGPEGRVAFAVVSYWISADTQKRVAVPFGALSCKERKCVLNASRDTLDAAPIYVLEDYLTEPKLAEDIYRYFGVQPYWIGKDSGK